MPRTPVTAKDIASAVATLLNGQTINSGTVKATANGGAVTVIVHSDASPPAHPAQFELFCH